MYSLRAVRGSRPDDRCSVRTPGGTQRACAFPSIMLLLVTTLLTLVSSGCADVQALPPEGLPQSMKGYELYSWRSGKDWRFTLITGSNRLKTLAEVTSRANIVEDNWIKVTVAGTSGLKAILDRIPAGAFIVWRGEPGLPSRPLVPRARLELPPRQLVEEIQSHCSKLGIQLEVSP